MTAAKTKRVKGDSYYGKVAENYQTRRAKQSWWQVEQHEMKALLEMIPRNLKVVDIPFGTGRFVPLYNDLDYEIFGLDASDQMIRQGANILGKSFDRCTVQVGNATNLPYENEQFDLLVSTRFLRDIITFGDAKLALAEFARVTKKFAIIQLGQNVELTEDLPSNSESMGSQLSENQIDALLISNGFKVVERRLVKSDPKENSEIYHVLCEKV